MGIGDLENLTRLSLQENDLSGDLPQELGNLSLLTSLRLEDNDLQGTIPPEFGGFAVVCKNYHFSNNVQMGGPIPIEMSELTQLNQFLTVGQTSVCRRNRVSKFSSKFV